MDKFLLKFVVNLERYDRPFTLNHGPLFHRWLPDGQRDAIELKVSNPSAALKVWFERRGFVEGFVRFDYHRTEIDPDLVGRQGFLDGGALFGLLEIAGLTEDEVQTLRDHSQGDEKYVAIGKRAVRLISDPVREFIETLRIRFGQYWLARFQPWDSREASVGAFARRLEMKGSLDKGETWFPFIPDTPAMSGLSVFTRPIAFRDYLTREDWQELADAVRDDFRSSLAAELLIRSHELWETGEYRYAFVEAVSGLEIALGEFVRGQLNQPLAETSQAFWNLPLPAKIIIVMRSIGRVSNEDLESIVEVIDIRNEIIHKGKAPTLKDEQEKLILYQKLRRTLRAAADLLGEPTVRFPRANPGNVLVPSEDQWPALYKEFAF